MVLRAMCHKDKRIGGSILATVDESFFDAPESKEILESIKKQMVHTGEPPLYKLVISDPAISEDARSFLRDSEANIQTVEDAKSAVKILNRYRQHRGMHELAVAIDTAMQGGKVDIEALMEDASSRVAAVRSSKSSRNEFAHFGLNNSSMALVKDLLYGDKTENVIPTGIAAYDEKSGGFLRGGLVTIGASSGGGKCCRLETKIQLSTLIVDLGEDLSIEGEPEDLILVNTDFGFVLRELGQLSEEDDVETDPQKQSQYLALLGVEYASTSLAKIRTNP